MTFYPPNPFELRHQREAFVADAVDAALADIESGRVGRTATRKYVECDGQWLKHYSRALEVHNRGFDKGKIIVLHEEGWTA